MKKLLVISTFVLLLGELSPSITVQSSIAGRWEGSIEQSTGELKLAVVLCSLLRKAPRLIRSAKWHP